MGLMRVTFSNDWELCRPIFRVLTQSSNSKAFRLIFSGNLLRVFRVLCVNPLGDGKTTSAEFADVGGVINRRI